MGGNIEPLHDSSENQGAPKESQNQTRGSYPHSRHTPMTYRFSRYTAILYTVGGYLLER